MFTRERETQATNSNASNFIAIYTNKLSSSSSSTMTTIYSMKIAIREKKMSVTCRLKQRALDNGKLFNCVKQQHQQHVDFKLPGERCGFTRRIEEKMSLKCIIETDDRAVVSLALLQKQSPILEAYANKLPIMTMNASRFLYTVEAFTYRNRNIDSTTAVQQALNFYFETDKKFRDVNLPPNQQFSDLLHRLKSSGYDDYIFELAREINLNVDLAISRQLIVRYIKHDSPASTRSSSIGFLTVIHDGDRWFVKTTKTPIATEK